MKRSMSRRQFLRAGAFGAVTAALAPLLDLPGMPVFATARILE